MSNPTNGETTLFLGGLWHGQRRAVPRPSAGIMFSLEPEPEPEPEEVYTRQRVPSSRYVVYVASDYDYDTREWFEACMPSYTDWQRCDTRLWRARRPRAGYWLYVLMDEQGRGFMCAPATGDDPEVYADLRAGLERGLSELLVDLEQGTGWAEDREVTG